MTFKIKKDKYKLTLGKDEYYFKSKKDLKKFIDSEPILYKEKVGY